MTTRTLAVVAAGLSTPSSTRLLADRLSAATVEALAERGVDAQVHVVELREHARDLADALVTGVAGPGLAAAQEAVTGADGVIAVTPVFSGSYSGLFKTFFDVLDRRSLTGRPVLVGATAGTARHALVLDHAMRPLFSYLRTLVVPTAVFATPEDWGAGEGAGAPLSARVERAAAELADLVAARPASAPADPLLGSPAAQELLGLA